MLDLAGIKAIVFDFDGTLILSNDIKRDCYLAVAEDWPNGRAIVTTLLNGPPVGDRYALFDLFAQRVAAQSAHAGGHDLRTTLADDYSRRVEDALMVCPERPGAMALLARLRAMGVPLFVNSGTPLTWLRPIVRGRGMEALFQELFGGPIRKIDNLGRICADLGVEARDILVVGDGHDDEAYALEAGCLFIPVAGGSLGEVPGAVADYADFAARLAALTARSAA